MTDTASTAQQLPERDASVPAEQQGLFRKFDVRRVDGSDQPGGKHHGCRYFVLDVDHDPCAGAALTAYAAACEATHPALAADLRTKWGAMPTAKAAPVAQGDAEDAARYRWLRDVGDETWTPFCIRTGYSAAQVDEAIDAARAQAKEGQSRG